MILVSLSVCVFVSQLNALSTTFFQNMLKSTLHPIVRTFHPNHTVNTVIRSKNANLRFYPSRVFSSLPPPKGTNPSPDVINFDPETIELIRTLLQTPGNRNILKFKYDASKIVDEAAVLVPLCIADQKPSVLFTIRSLNLKTHMGE
ncbi:5984_t:CDS:2, partial [Acaulospora morrowiae]